MLRELPPLLMCWICHFMIFDADNNQIELMGANIGIGNSNPAAFLDILGTTEQLRLSYDISNYLFFSVDSAGELTFADTGTDIATFGASQVSFDVPASFNASGDVSMAYNLQFTNQTSSNIRSLAPLNIEVGENFENNDLTLKTYGTGNVIADLSGTGSLELVGTDTSIIFNTDTATDTDYWVGIIDDAGSDDDDIFAIGDGAIPGSNNFLAINTSGNLGIGTTNPLYKLNVNGDMRISNLGAGANDNEVPQTNRVLET